MLNRFVWKRQPEQKAETTNKEYSSAKNQNAFHKKSCRKRAAFSISYLSIISDCCVMLVFKPPEPGQKRLYLIFSGFLPQPPLKIRLPSGTG
jgi:hypothetical protein